MLVEFLNLILIAKCSSLNFMQMYTVQFHIVFIGTYSILSHILSFLVLKITENVQIFDSILAKLGRIQMYFSVFLSSLFTFPLTLEPVLLVHLTELSQYIHVYVFVYTSKRMEHLIFFLWRIQLGNTKRITH